MFPSWGISPGTSGVLARETLLPSKQIPVTQTTVVSSLLSSDIWAVLLTVEMFMQKNSSTLFVYMCVRPVMFNTGGRNEVNLEWKMRMERNWKYEMCSVCSPNWKKKMLESKCKRKCEHGGGSRALDEPKKELLLFFPRAHPGFSPALTEQLLQ